MNFLGNIKIHYFQVVYYHMAENLSYNEFMRLCQNEELLEHLISSFKVKAIFGWKKDAQKGN